MPISFLAKEAGHVHICGHRGHSVGAPENTIAAFRANRELGGTSVEIDTVLTKDDHIVVLHDLTVDRTTNGTGVVKDMTLAEVQALDAGSKFDQKFAGERIPTLREALDVARELDLVFEIEIKEKVRLERYIEVLKDTLADPADMQRVMMISFDHLSLKQAKAAIPGLKTGGIVHERYGDPVVVARSADLDELCIDLSVYELEDAEKLHAAGISIRCHAYKPEYFDRAIRSGLPWNEILGTALRNGLIDTLSGDDVAWLRDYVANLKA
ncbi:MAG TPA: glycerophosphodiester phosphodiesterase family protein [Devosiaceae bacterium]|jgi:glycerophosphoryl diester phosphodiesterase